MTFCRECPLSRQWLESLIRKPRTVLFHERRLSKLFEYIEQNGGPAPSRVDFARLIPIRVGGTLIGYGPVNARFFEQFLQWYATGTDPNKSGRKRNEMIHTLRMYCRFLNAHGVLLGDPTYHLTPAKVIRRVNHKKYLTPSESAKLLKAAAVSGDHAPRNLAIIATLLRSGVRPQELCSIETKGLDLESGWCVVTGKTGRRSAPVPPALIDILRRYIGSPYFAERVRKPALAGLFPNDSATGPLTSAELLELVKTLVAAAELNKAITTYWTRHTFATDAYRGGTPFLLIAEALGHTKLKNTPAYVHSREDRMRSIAENGPAIGPVLDMHRELVRVAETQKHSKRP